MQLVDDLRSAHANMLEAAQTAAEAALQLQLAILASAYEARMPAEDPAEDTAEDPAEDLASSADPDLDLDSMRGDVEEVAIESAGSVVPAEPEEEPGADACAPS